MLVGILGQGQETFDLYYQVDGKLILLAGIRSTACRKNPSSTLPQASAVAHVQ